MSDGGVPSLEAARADAKRIGYPVLIKASAGGGGRGMKVARSPEEIDLAFSSARSEAKAAFGNEAVYMEKYLEKPRHIEIQVVADSHGNVIHLGEQEDAVVAFCATREQAEQVGREGAVAPVRRPHGVREFGTTRVEATRRINV